MMEDKATPVAGQVISWQVLKLYAAQAWPNFKATNLFLTLKAKGLTVHAQASNGAGKVSTKLNRPLRKDLVQVLAARYAEIAPLSRIDMATVAINYLTGKARVAIYYIDENGAAKKYYEDHVID